VRLARGRRGHYTGGTNRGRHHTRPWLSTIATLVIDLGSKSRVVAQEASAVIATSRTRSGPSRRHQRVALLWRQRPQRTGDGLQLIVPAPGVVVGRQLAVELGRLGRGLVTPAALRPHVVEGDVPGGTPGNGTTPGAGTNPGGYGY
jgi:hypothetical protein